MTQSLNTEAILKQAFATAVAVADPQLIVPQYLAKIFRLDKNLREGAWWWAPAKRAPLWQAH